MLVKRLISLIAVLGFLVVSSCSLFIAAPSRSSSFKTMPGDIYYVKTSGSDSTGTGSIEFPFATIQKAIDTMVKAGVKGQVHVAAGTYEVSEPVEVAEGISLFGGYSDSDWNDRSYIKATDRAQTKYKTLVKYIGTNDGALDLVAPTVEIAYTVGATTSDITTATVVEGFTINAKDTGTLVSGLGIENSANPTIQYNTINGATSASSSCGLASLLGLGDIKNNDINGGTSTGGSGGVMAFMSGVTLTNNRIDAGVSSGRAYAVFVFTSTSALISSNSIIGGSGPVTTYALYIDKTPDVTISDNTIDAGASDGDAVAIYAKGEVTTLDITDNIINSGTSSAGSVKAIEVSSSASGTISGNTLTGGRGRGMSSVDLHGAGTIDVNNNIIEAGESTSTVSTAILISDSNSVQISSNDINGGTAPTQSYAVNITGTPVTISQNVINGGTAASLTRGIYTTGIESVLSITENNINPGTSSAGEARGIDAVGSSTGSISGNTFSGGSGKSMTTIRLEHSGITVNSNTIEVATVEDRASGISLYDVGSTNIFNNTIIGAVTTDDISSGIYTYGTSSPLIANNTIINGNSTFGSIAILSEGGGSGIIKNNIIYSVCSGVAISSSTKPSPSLTIKNNSFFGTTEIYYYGFTSHHYYTVVALETAFPSDASANVDVGVEPVFESYAGKDFRLNASTPSAIKAGGLNLSTSFTVDKSGATRSVPWSIGAYEKN